MEIVLAIVGLLAILIAVILLSPVKIIIQNDATSQLVLRYKYLFKTFGENPDPNDPITRALKSATGVNRLEGKTVQKNIREGGLVKTVTDSYSMLADLLREVVALLKFCTVSSLYVKIRCTGEDVDDAAIHYGQCCAATYGLLNVLRNLLKVRERGCKIDVACDFHGKEPVFKYKAVLTIRAGRVLAGFWKTALAEAKRMHDPQSNQQK